MNRTTRALVAAGAGVLLLLEGGGTLAFWSHSENVAGGTISSGHLRLVTDATNTGCGAWTLDTAGGASGYTAGDPLVPGDVLSRQCSFTVQAEGNHLQATVAVSTATFSGADADFGGHLLPSVSALTVGGTPATSFTDQNDGQALEATITVTFDPAAGNDTQGLTTRLDDLTLTATQVHA